MYHPTSPDQGDDVPTTVYEYVMLDEKHEPEFANLFGTQFTWAFKSTYRQKGRGSKTIEDTLFLCVNSRLEDPLALGMFLVYIGPVKKRDWTTIQLFSLDKTSFPGTAITGTNYGYVQSDVARHADSIDSIPIYLPINRQTLGFVAKLARTRVYVRACGEKETIKIVNPDELAQELLRLRRLGITDIRCGFGGCDAWIPMN